MKRFIRRFTIRKDNEPIIEGVIDNRDKWLSDEQMEQLRDSTIALYADMLDIDADRLEVGFIFKTDERC